MTFAAVGVLMIIAITVPLVLAGMRNGSPRPAPVGTPTAGLPTAATATALASAPPPGTARDAAPTGLTVTVTGPTATLRWKLVPGNDYPLMVDQPSTGNPPAYLPGGTTSYTVIGLHQGIEYCFKVGTVTATGGQYANIQFSKVACAPG
jgi:hypothetical protein